MKQRREYTDDYEKNYHIYACNTTKEVSNQTDELTIFITVFDALLGLRS